MTVERKIVVGLEDIRAITLECECGARTTFAPELFRTVPHHCTHCGKAWTKFEEFGPSPGIGATAWLLTTLRDLRVLIREKSLPFRILLEFNEPDSRG